MKFPSTHGRRRAVLVSALLALLAVAPPARAQDCWLPDAFEPNDLTPATIGPGLHTGLGLHANGIGITADSDLYSITIPPRQRVTVDFTYEVQFPSFEPEQHPIYGRLTAQDGSGAWIGYRADGDGPDRTAYFDNPHAHALDVELSARVAWFSAIGCREYDLLIDLSPLPCDGLGDDALEGPDDCASGTVLQPGLYEDLIVFNAIRAAGRDVDYYRILDVQPGNSFEIRVLDPDGASPDLRMEVFDDASCTQALGNSQSQYAANTTNAPRDYFVRVWTTDTAGFQKYALQLEWLPCNGATPDRFEPNDVCGSFTMLSAGIYQQSYDELSLSTGDVDGFEIAVPPGNRLNVSASAHVSDAWLRIVGASAPACPTLGSGGQTEYAWQNRTNATVLQRFAISSTPGFCGVYDMYVSVEPELGSAADLQRFEPNEDCSTATLVALRLDDNQQPISTSWQTTLDDGDVDSFRVWIPAESAFAVNVRALNHGEIGIDDEPAFELYAFVDGDCTNSPLRSACPHWSSDGNLPLGSELLMLLQNRSNVDVEYVLQLGSPETITGSESYSIELTPDTNGFWSVDYAASDPTCADATPLRDGDFITQTLAPNRPVRASLTLLPGESMTAYLDGDSIISACAGMHLRIHDGRADCATGGATLGSLSVDPLDLDPLDPSAQIPLAYTNQSSDLQRIIVECALDAGATRALTYRLRIRTTPNAAYQPYCTPDSSPVSWPRCPCGNRDDQAQFLTGCENSTGAGGRLSGTGTQVVQNDDLVLRVDGLPSHAVGIILHGGPSNLNASASYFDGMLCIPLDSSPLWTFHANAAGSWIASGSTHSALQTLGSNTFQSFLQCWYRDPSGPCGSGSNTTNAIRVDWE